MNACGSLLYGTRPRSATGLIRASLYNWVGLQWLLGRRIFAGRDIAVFSSAAKPAEPSSDHAEPQCFFCVFLSLCVCEGRRWLNAGSISNTLSQHRASSDQRVPFRGRASKTRAHPNWIMGRGQTRRQALIDSTTSNIYSKPGLSVRPTKNVLPNYPRTTLRH